ncbi:cation:proton antiporter [bacterium]|nr:cation:proton antiporter [bacterium]
MSKKYLHLIVMSLILIAIPSILWAANTSGEESSFITDKMVAVILQIGIIIVVSKFGGLLFEKIKLPSVMGELLAGMIIGPFMLGSIPIAGFAHGIIPLSSQGGISISPELYSFATVASILLLFITGLETDLNLLRKFFIGGALVGISGVIVSYIIGAGTAVWLLPILFPVQFPDTIGFMNPTCMFIGVLSTATSVGITARILSERKKIASPEGVTILAGAVIDDVLGILVLAIVIGLCTSDGGQSGASRSINWGQIGSIALKAISVWLGFTAIGLIFSKKISFALKLLKKPISFSLFSLALAFFMACVFEKAGLAMIIGAYVVGLSLANTDISYVIQEKLRPIYDFLVPLFFTVSGMLINIKSFASKEVIILGGVLGIGAILAKIIGCGLPTFLLKFNMRGAARIGIGMAPRGEVALIIAAIALSRNIFDHNIFAAVIMMPMLCDFITPPFINLAFASDKKGINKNVNVEDKIFSEFTFPSMESTTFVVSKIIDYFKKEGFFINLIIVQNKVYQIRKDNIFLSLTCYPTKIIYNTSVDDVAYVKTLMYEALLDLYNTVESLKQIAKPEELKKDLLHNEGKTKINIANHLDVNCIIPELKGTTKTEVINELIDLLYDKGKIKDKQMVNQAVWAREKTMSTGLQDGLAIPHCRTEAVKKSILAVGLCRKGIEFESLDGQPAKIIILIISPVSASAHIQILAGISSLLNDKNAALKLLSYDNPRQIRKFFSKKSNKQQRI